MVLYKQNQGVKFLIGQRGFYFAPDDGASANGAAAQQAGAREGAASAVPVDPFEGIDFDDLDPAARKVLEKTREVFATTQKQAADERKAREYHEAQARKFQGQFDQLASQVQKQNGQQAAEDPKTVLIGKLTQQMVDKGIAPETAKLQAPLMADMLNTYGETLRQDIGRDLAPIAGSVIMRETEAAWNQFVPNDKFGALQIPEVASAVWASATEIANSGTAVNAATIKNLTAMAYVEHLEKTGQPVNQPASTPPPVQQRAYPSVGVTSFPGSVPYRPAVADPRAPKHQLDSGTAAALAKISADWNVSKKK